MNRLVTVLFISLGLAACGVEVPTTDLPGDDDDDVATDFTGMPGDCTVTVPAGTKVIRSDDISNVERR